MTDRQKKKVLRELMAKQKHLLTDLFYPSAKEWMWSYCIPLGKYIHYINDKEYYYDLGVHIGHTGLCGAIVYGDNDGNYYSGELKVLSGGEHYKECTKRFIDLFGQNLYDELNKI